MTFFHSSLATQTELVLAFNVTPCNFHELFRFVSQTMVKFAREIFLFFPYPSVNNQSTRLARCPLATGGAAAIVR
jgi:hypothetical protein